MNLLEWTYVFRLDSKTDTFTQTILTIELILPLLPLGWCSTVVVCVSIEDGNDAEPCKRRAADRKVFFF